MSMPAPLVSQCPKCGQIVTSSHLRPGLDDWLCPECATAWPVLTADRTGRAVEWPQPIDKALASQRQEGGNHYKAMKIQPFEYIHANGIPFAEGSVIKYVTRWRAKNGIEDLKKARHFLDLLIEAEQAE